MELHGPAQSLVPALLLVGRQPLPLPHWASCQWIGGDVPVQGDGAAEFQCPGG